MSSRSNQDRATRARASGVVLVLWALVFTPIVLLDVLVVIAFVVALRSESQLTMVLEVLRVAIAWPMVVLAIAVVFGLAFRPEIGDAIKRLVVKVANVEIGTRQAEKDAADAGVGSPGEAGDPPVATEAVAAKTTEVTAAVVTSGNAGVAETVGASTDSELARTRELSALRMRHWWYWWLQTVQLRLVARTVLALRWLLEQEGGTAQVAAFDQRFRPMITAEDKETELAAMFNVLLQFDLVISPPSRATMTITESGRKFLNYLDGKWNPIEDLTIT